MLTLVCSLLVVVCKSLVMAPKQDSKQAPQPKGSKRKSSEKAPSDMVEDETVSKGDQSNFTTQMNSASKAGQLTPEQEAAWSKYKTLGRFDKDKKELIAQLKMDKSCKWIQHCSKSQEKVASVECETVGGWGTRHPFK